MVYFIFGGIDEDELNRETDDVIRWRSYGTHSAVYDNSVHFGSNGNLTTTTIHHDIYEQQPKGTCKVKEKEETRLSVS